MAELEGRAPRDDRSADVARGDGHCAGEPARPAPTPAERAQDAIAVFAREAAVLGDAVDRVRGAHAANEVERWTEARGRLDGALVQAGRAREQARGRAVDAVPEAAGRLAAAEGQVDELAAAARGLTEPPTGIAKLAREGELQAALAAPIAGSVAAGYERKEAAVRAEFDRLSAAESRVLAERLRRARPNDPLASLFGRMTADRRDRLLAHLDGARRREALRVARTPRMPPPASAAHRAAPAPAVAVADTVVRGEPASRLLDDMAGRGATAAPAVQRTTLTLARNSNTIAGPATPSYVDRDAASILAAIADRVTRVGVPEPHARLRWKTPKEAAAAIARAIRTYVEGARARTLDRLMELSQPADLNAIVDDLRRGPGSASWRPEIGGAIAAAFDEPIAASLQRMGPRIRARLDTQIGMPSASSLIASCPLDRVVGELLVNPALVVVGAKQRGGADDTPGRTFEHGPRHVTFEWQGARDRALWNWIRVKSPADATAEEVAQVPFGGGEVTDSEQAYRIAASPPYFGIPLETARRVPEAVQHAPFDVQRRLDLGHPGPRSADRSALARSAVSDDAALAQAPKPTKNDPSLEHAIERSSLQLAFMQQRLAPWKAAGPLAAATRFLERRRAELASDRRKAERWAPTAAAQERILYGTSSELAEVLAELTARGAAPSAAAALGPVVRVLEGYAHAGGVSHLQAEAPAALDAARHLRALLPLAMAGDKIRLAREAVRAQQGAQLGGNVVDPNARQTIASVPDLAARGADLRLAATRSGALDAEVLEELAADADLTNLRAQIITLRTQLAAVENRATAAGVPDARYRDGLPTLRAFPAALRKESDRWLDFLEGKNVHFGPGEGSERARHTAWKRRAMDNVARQLAAYKDLAGVGKPDGYFEWAKRAIADKLWRDLISGVAVQIAILLATAQVASAGIAVLRGVAIGAEVVSGIRAAGTVFKIAEVVTQAGLATGVQGLMGGNVGRREFAENALTMVLGNAAMRPFRGLLQQLGTVEQEVHALAKGALRGGKFAAALALETGTGIAASAVARMAVHGGRFSISSTDEWISQAVSFAAGRFVHQRVQRVRERLRAAKEQRREASEAVEAVTKQAEALEQQAAASKQPTVEEAASLLASYRRLLELERPLYPAKPGDRLQAASAADRSAFGPEAVEIPLHLAKLSPVVGGEIYEGSPAQIKQAFETAKTLGISLEPTYDATAGIWRVRAGTRTIAIRETGGRQPGAIESATAKPQEKKGTVEKPPSPGRPDGVPTERSVKRIPVQISELNIADRLTSKEWIFTIEAPLPNGKDLIVAYGSVMLDANRRPVGGPQFVFDKRVVINGEEHRVSIVQGASGNAVSLTDYSLDQSIQYFKTRFGHAPDELSGSLIDDNRSNFQKEYLKGLDDGLAAHEAQLKAAREISFGRSRIERGYTELTVEAHGEATISYGTPSMPRKVPAQIHIVARRK